MKVPLGRQSPWVGADGGSAESLYELVGSEWFVSLVERFYEGVADDELLAAVEIREALDGLGAVMGTVYTDDILDRVFSKFCIGK